MVIINDTSSESLEEFELELTLDTNLTPDSLSVIVRPNKMVIVIRDDDQLNIGKRHRHFCVPLSV